jgi:hypothetical protein
MDRFTEETCAEAAARAARERDEWFDRNGQDREEEE